MKVKKFSAHYEKLRDTVIYYILLLFLVPLLVCYFCYVANKEDLSVLPQECFKWCTIVMPIFFVWFVFNLVFYSDYIIFTDTQIIYFRWFFSKKSRTIDLGSITECIVGMTRKFRKSKIHIIDKGKEISSYDFNPKLILKLIYILTERTIRLVDCNFHLITVSRCFDIDFMSLTYEQQIKLIKHYCKRRAHKSAAKILKLDKKN